MARLFSCGFELNSCNIEFNGDINGSLTTQSTTARSGTYALRVNNLVSAAQKRCTHQFVSANSNGPFWVRFYLRLTTAPTADNQIFNFRNSSGTRIVYIVINSSGALELWDEDGQVGSDSSALSVGTWYRVEVKVDASGAGANDVVEGKIDGTTFATSSTRDLSSGVFSASFGGNLNAEAQTQSDWYFDDIAINDSTGSFQTGYPGAGGILHLLPDGAGDAADWTGAYTDVDEVTPDDATTLISSNTLNQVEEVTLAATPAAIGASDVINWVGVYVKFNVSDATGADPAFVQRLKSAPGGTTEESSAVTTQSTAWASNQGSNPRNYQNFPNNSNYEQPGGSSAWTKAALDTAQIGVRVSTGDTHSCQVTSLQLVVDFTPSSGLSGSINQVTETDTAQAMSRSKSKAIGLNTETDTAQAMSRSKSKAIGLTSTTDSPLALTPVKTNTIGPAAETGTSQPMTSLKTKAIGLNTETDNPLALTPVKTNTIGPVAETGTAQPMTSLKTRAIGQSTETNTPLAVTPLKIRAIGIVSETDTVQPVASLKTKAIGQASETDSALGMGTSLSANIGLTQETDLALSLFRTKIRAIGISAETDSLLPVGRLKLRQIAIVSENDVALSLVNTVIGRSIHVYETEQRLDYPSESRVLYETETRRSYDL